MIHILENINLDEVGHGVTTDAQAYRKSLVLNKTSVTTLKSQQKLAINTDNPNWTSSRCVNLSKDGDCVPTVGYGHPGCLSQTSWWCWCSGT